MKQKFLLAFYTFKQYFWEYVWNVVLFCISLIGAITVAKLAWFLGKLLTKLIVWYWNILG